LENVSCFISYSADSEGHEEWVRKLAEALQNNGVDTALDQWDCYLGVDLTKYMETSIRESDFVMMVCTPIYAEKANAGRGGVGYEKMIITGEIFEAIASPKKFVPILRSGNPQNSLPSFLKSRKFIGFRDDNKFDLQITMLLRHIYAVPKHPRPALGSKPLFDEASSYAEPIQSIPMKASHTDKSLDRYKEVYHFASGILLGMNLSPKDAEAFAADWMERFADKDFERFKEVYAYASGILIGMNLSSNEAKIFAIDWMEEFSDKDFAQFKEAYNFASGVLGMNLNREDAIAFALKRVGKR
jgi:hypothetical protein